MRIILQHDLEMLKVLVLHKAEIQVLLPSIVKDLASSIFLATKKSISDTTLKRIFGFAEMPHQPSQYTINALAEYCGYRSYQEFCERQVVRANPIAKKASITNSSHYLRARALSEHTLQALKNKSGIPYHLSIPREFLGEHMQLFEQSGTSATIISSPTGYGKTIALCHWVEEKLNNSCKSEGKEIVLFLSGKVLNRGNLQVQLFDWLADLAGFTNHADHSALHQSLCTDKFYFIIDAFDTTSLEQPQWALLLDMLMDTVSAYRANPNFKLILTMRSSSWIDCRRQLQSNGQIEQWYEGFWTDTENLINIPLLSAYEIKQLCNRISPKSHEQKLCPEAINFFSYPLFLNYYYQKNKEQFSLEKLDTYHVFEIVHQYIYEKVYTGTHATEKMMLIHSIIDRAAVENAKLTVEKLRFYDQLTLFKEAFRELKSNGILREINNSDQQGFAEIIEFSNSHLQTYFMASKLIFVHERVFDAQLIDSINRISDRYVRLKVLKWCIFTALKSGQHFMFQHLSTVNLMGREKCKLIKFLGHLIEEEYLQPPNDQHFDVAYPKLFDYFFAVEFYGPDLYGVLTMLAKQQLSPKGLTSVHAAICIENLLQLNPEATEHTLAKLSGLGGKNSHYFHVNPVKCLDSLYTYLRFKKVKQAALEEITHFYFHPALLNQYDNSPGMESIVNLMALNTLQITGNLKKQLRFVSLLIHSYHERANYLPAYLLILLINKAQLLRAMGKNAELIALMGEINDKTIAETQLTAYIETRLDYLEAQLAADRQDLAKLSALTVKYTGTKKSAYPMIEVNIIVLLLDAMNLDKESIEYRALHIRFIKHLQATRFTPEAFLFHFNPLNSLKSVANKF